MNCKDIGEHLIDAALGVVPDVSVEAHLRSCPACRQHLVEMRSTMALLDEWKAPEPSPYFDTHLQARLREEKEQTRGFLQWFRRPALAAAVAALLIVGGTLFTTGRYTPAPQMPSAAVQDLQDLDKNHDLFANFELVDDVAVDQNSQSANP
jgi:predicted anti-sigma-YlaC factor YlaD